MSLKLHDVNVVHSPKKFRVTRPLPLLFGLFFWPAFSLASKFGVAVSINLSRKVDCRTVMSVAAANFR